MHATCRCAASDMQAKSKLFAQQHIDKLKHLSQNSSPEKAHHPLPQRRLPNRRQDCTLALQPQRNFLLRSWLHGVLRPLARSPNQHCNVALLLLLHASLAKPLGRLRRLQRHVLAAQLSRVPMGRAKSRTRELGLRTDILQAELPGSGELWSVEFRAQVACLVG
jgi:hypothetical protein